jgi:hypothetical protein
MLQQLHALSRAAQRPRTVSAAAWSAAAAVSAAAWSAQLARPSPLAWSPNMPRASATRPVTTTDPLLAA